MARYRKIDTRIWNDEKFRALSDDGKLLFLFLLTHPHMTSIGAMRATLSGLADEIHWSKERLSKAFAEPLSKGMARHDPKASVMWLPKFILYNQPENPNVLKAWAGALDLLPESELTNEAIQAVKGFAEGLSEAFRKALPEAFTKPFRKGMAKPEQEQEQEPRAGGTAKAVAAKAAPLPDWLPPKAWNDFVEMRKRIKAPLSDAAVAIAVKTLEKLKGQGENLTEVLEQSTMNSWRGVFAVHRHDKGKGAVSIQEGNRAAAAAFARSIEENPE